MKIFTRIYIFAQGKKGELGYVDMAGNKCDRNARSAWARSENRKCLWKQKRRNLNRIW